MANPSVSVPDELLEDFDEVIKQKKLDEELPLETSRSEVIAQLMEDYVEGNLSTSNGSVETQTAD